MADDRFENICKQNIDMGKVISNTRNKSWKTDNTVTDISLILLMSRSARKSIIDDMSPNPFRSYYDIKRYLFCYVIIHFFIGLILIFFP